MSEIPEFQRPPQDDPDVRCTCPHEAGSDYYCLLHGGSGSYAAVVAALLHVCEAYRDDEALRELREVARRWPDDHPAQATIADVLASWDDDPDG